MGIISDLIGGSAAKKAASAQMAAAQDAIDYTQESAGQVRTDLAPYQQAGAEGIQGLSGLVTDPNQQKAFVQDNPFYQSMADDAQSRIFGNAAARGKVGSGGTAEALQNSLMLLGNDLVNQNINQRMNLGTMGQNAAGTTGQAAMQGASTISDLYTQQGNAAAAGKVGAANAWQSGLNTLGTAIGGFF